MLKISLFKNLFFIFFILFTNSLFLGCSEDGSVEVTITTGGTDTTNTTTTTNSAPTITSSATVSVNENQTSAFTITATDADLDPLTYSLTGTDVGSFDINSSTGVVTFTFVPNYELNSSEYNITANVSDGTDTTTQDVTINVLNVAEFPPTLTSSTLSVEENLAAGTYVGNITISNFGDTAISAITLSGTGSANFSVDTSGAVTTTSILDFTTPLYNLTAVATNDAGNSDPVNITISIIEVVVPILAASTGSVAEDAADGTSVGNITITNDGATAITAITLSGTGAGNFVVDTAGAITVATGATLDYEATPSYSLTAVATNLDGNSTSVAVTINIINVAETSPVLATSTGTVAENAADGTSVGTVTITEAGDTAITAITLSGIGSTNFIVSTAGAITVNTGATLDFETTPSYSLTAVATNTFGASNSVSVTISVTDIVDTLATLAISTGSVDENATLGTYVGDVNITSSGDSAITAIALSGTGSTDFTVDTNGAITVAGALDYETISSYSLTAVATNTAGNSTGVAVTISVTDIVDTAPTLTASTGSVAENATATTFVGNLTISSIGDTAITGITLSGTGNGNFSVDTSGVITTTSILDYEAASSYSLTAVATNDAGDSASVALTINIINVAETVPVLAASSGSVSEDAADGTSVGTVTITDIGDTAISTITLSGTGSTNFIVSTAGAITVAAGATVDYETAQDYNLTAIATNTAGNSASVDVTISVTNVTDTPATLAASTGTVAEDATIGVAVGNVIITDSGDAAITAITLSGTGSENFDVSTDGNITVASGATLDYETTPTYSLTAEATNGLVSTGVTVTINVTDVADVVPTLVNFTASIDENVTIGTVVGSITVSDVGDSSITSYTLNDYNDFNISAAGEITTVTTFDYNTTSVYGLTVFATNSAGDSNSVDVIININNPTTPVTSICDATSLTFDSLPVIPTTPSFTMWVDGQDGVLDSTSLNWEPIDGAWEYLVDIATTNYSATGWNFWDVTNMSFVYNGVVGLSPALTVDSYILTSADFTVGANVTLTLRAVDTSYQTIATSEPITFTIGQSYTNQAPAALPAPQRITSSSGNGSVGLEWCAIDTTPDSYTVKYGTSELNLNLTKSTVDGTTLSEIVSSLTNETGYYFSVAADVNGSSGEFSEVINTTPKSLNEFDLSIENVTFNQSVQVDLDSNTNGTPIISNKPGVLRVFVNSSSPDEKLKVEVKLGGTDINGTTLTPIIKEVALSNSTLATSDSTNNVIHFDVNTTEWMQAGTTFYVELDPDNKIAELDDTNNRYPGIATEQSFGFEDRYKMRVKLIPVTTNNGAVVITQDHIDGTKAYLESIYPLDEVEVTVGAVLNSPYTPLADGSGWNEVLSDVQVQKDIDVSGDSTLADVFYYGVIESASIDPYGVGGLAYNNNFDITIQAPWLVGIGRIDEIGLQKFYEIAAHEIGHNHGRSHVDSTGETNDNCGVAAGIDGAYPYALGRISKTGFSSVAYNLLEKELYHDIMSYCDRYWISDYNYKAIYDFQVILDTLYSRSTNPNAYLAPPLIHRTLGNMIYGDVNEDVNNATTYTLKRQLEIVWDSEISQSSTKLYAIVKFINGTEMRIPFVVVSLDHVDAKKFKFFIPSTEEIDSIVIEDTELSTFTTMQ